MSSEQELAGNAKNGCEICKERETIRRSKVPVPYKVVDPEALSASQAAGCYVCGVIWTGIREHVGSAYHEYNIDGVVWNYGNAGDRHPLLVGVNIRPYWINPIPPGPNQTIDLRMYTPADERVPGSIFGTGRTVPARSDSMATFSTVKNWLEQCVQNHTDCRQAPTSLQELPTRLLDVGTVGPTVKVIDARRDTTKYFTLSYCWGKSVPFITTTTNIDERKKSIRISELPRTFKDAITLTRLLGYRYIWIDALCILQDSPEDWDVESSKMATVYHHSTLTISVAHGKNTEAGCFHRRTHFFCHEDAAETVSPRELSTTSFKFQPAPGIQQTVYVSRVFEHDVIRRGAKRNPLFTRAWTFQERLLSPRTVHLTEDEAVWECWKGVDCECGGLEHTWSKQPRVDNNRFLNNEVLASIRRSIELLQASAGSPMPFGWIGLEKLRVLEPWRLLVEEYSDRKLSHTSDKLKAVSGVARYLQVPELGSYYAGAWAVELPFALVWAYSPDLISKDLRETKRPYTAPSWSWASVDGQTKFAEAVGTHQFILATVEDIHCQLSTADPFGHIDSGYIVITAPLWSCWLSHLERKGFEETSPTPRVGLRAYIDGLPYWASDSTFTELHMSSDDGPEALRLMYVSSCYQKDLLEIQFPRKFYFLHIIASGPDSPEIIFPRDYHQKYHHYDDPWPTPTDPGSMKIQGIILKDSQKEHGAFERCGVFELNLYKLSFGRRVTLDPRIPKTRTVKII